MVTIEASAVGSIHANKKILGWVMASDPINDKHKKAAWHALQAYNLFDELARENPLPEARKPAIENC